ncbi:MAG: PEP-CTERM sorting domain-containing protein [Kiritimatiellia bacterium]|nr:PEP-CTERM sorting domain-containing protein [Kiritimatiellia bacterium]
MKRMQWMGLAVSGLVCASMSFGQATWTNRFGGALNEAANWTNQVPGAGVQLRMFNGGVPNGTVMDVWLTDHLTAGYWDGGYGTYIYNLDLKGYNLTLDTTAVSGWQTTVSTQNSTNVVYNTSETLSTVTANRLAVGGAAGSRTLLDIVGSNVLFITTGTGDRNINGEATTGLAGDPGGIVRIRDGALWTNSTANILIGTGTGRHGALVVQGDGSRLHIDVSRYILPGGWHANTSIGTLEVTQGGKVSGGYLYFGREVGNLGYGIFDGLGSSYTNGAFGDNGRWIYIGGKGTGVVSVANQAVVGTREDVWIGIGHINSAVMNADAYGELTVSSGGEFHSRDSHVGQLATGKVFVNNGGKFHATGPGGLILGAGEFSTTNNAAALGTLSVSNLNSLARVQNLTIGGTGTGHAEVVDQAVLSVYGTGANGAINLNRGSLRVSDASVIGNHLTALSGTTVRIELGARDHGEYYVDLANVLTLNSGVTLDIVALDSFSADIDDTIYLINFLSLSGEFNNLKNGNTFSSNGYDFRFNVDNDTYTEMSLTVIPEPGTLGLIASGLGLAAILRRRRTAT